MIDTELRRLLTNAVGDRRDEIRSIMREVANMRAEIKALRIENNKLKKELAEQSN
jgi:regulator of replication initiation timing